MGFTEEEKKRLETQSTENMLIFYAPEMRKIAEGERATELINKKMIKRFLALGILIRSMGRGYSPYIQLSRKGRELYGLTED